MKQFQGRVAVITGAASGIGLAVARNLADKGCDLAISDINEEALQEAVTDLTGRGVKVHSAVLDVADKKAWPGYTKAVIDTLGKANIVVNNAGIGIAGLVEDMSIEDFERTMNIHFGGVLYGTKFFLPHLQTQDEGHIVNVSSAAGLVGAPGMSAYSAAKFAIRGFTESLRQELADSAIGVSCVHPGGVATNIVKNGESTAKPFGLGIDVVEDLAKMDDAFQRLALTSADEAAEIIANGIKNNRPRILVGPDAYVIDLVQRMAPVNYGILSAVAGKLIEQSASPSKDLRTRVLELVS